MKEHYEEQPQIKKCKSCHTLGLAYNEHSDITNRLQREPSFNTLGPAYNEFGYNEHLLITNSFFCIFLLVVSDSSLILVYYPPLREWRR